MRKHKIIVLSGLLITILTASFLFSLVNHRSISQMKKDPENLPVTKTFLKFDTVITIKLFGDKDADKHLQEIDQLLDRIDGQINMYNMQSVINQVNASAGKKAVTVPDETFRLVKKSMEYAHDTEGAFNPAIGALVKLWGIGNGGEHPPAEHLIEQAKSLSQYSDIELNENKSSIKLVKSGMSIDLGAIGKGYAADLIADYLRGEKVESALIDLGGSSITTIGSKPGGADWHIGIQEPDQLRGEDIGTIPLKNNTISTSGVYERYFVFDGIRYHHILDSKTGVPTRNGILSVTIIGGTAAAGDALTTAVIVKGLKEGISYLEKKTDTEGIFITEDKKIYITSGLHGKFKLTNPNYTLATLN